MFDHVELTSTRPAKSGYYFVKWSENEEMLLLYIDYLIRDGIEFWCWRYTQNDDSPNDIFFDAQESEYPLFSEEIPVK
ncbi:S-layer protein [Chryseobacterium sp. IT-36CA2]